MEVASTHSGKDVDITDMKRTKQRVKNNCDAGCDRHEFASAFVQQMSHVLLNAQEAASMRELLKDCIGQKGLTDMDKRKTQLFHIILHTFSHNFVAALSLCLWGGAFRTASRVIRSIHPLDVNLVFLLEADRLVELLERPLFRHLHLRMLEGDSNPRAEGSAAMLFLTLKSLLMVLPQSSCYNVLSNRLVSTARFRQTAVRVNPSSGTTSQHKIDNSFDVFVDRILSVRRVACDARWLQIRAESLETPSRPTDDDGFEAGTDRRSWLGYDTKEAETTGRQQYSQEKDRLQGKGGVFRVEEAKDEYHDFEKIDGPDVPILVHNNDNNDTLGNNADDGEATHTEPTFQGGKPESTTEGEQKDGDQWEDLWTKTEEDGSG